MFCGRTGAFGRSFPWGYIHTDAPGKEVISATEAREDYYLAIGGTNLLGVTCQWEKDAWGDPTRFGYSETNAFVDRSFETNLDLTVTDYGVVLAMFADDKAEISIYEFGDNGEPGGEPVHTFGVAGGGAWRPVSYQEDDFILVPGKKYKLDLAYRNSMFKNSL